MQNTVSLRRNRLRELIFGASSAALGAGLAFGPISANAQAVPGVDPECTITADAALCEGDLSDGVSSGTADPAFDTLTIQNVTGTIAPAGYTGIDIVKADRDISIIVQDGVVIDVFDDQTIAGLARGLFGATLVGFDLRIENGGDITVDGNGGTASALEATAQGGEGTITIINTGDISATSVFPAATAIYAYTVNGTGAVSITNSGELFASSGGSGERDNPTAGIFALQDSTGGMIDISNTGNIAIVATDFDTDLDGIAAAIGSNAFDGSTTTGFNSGTLMTTAQNSAGVNLVAFDDTLDNLSTVFLENEGDMIIDGVQSFGVNLTGRGTGRVNLTLDNSGNTTLLNGDQSYGLYFLVEAKAGDFVIENSGSVSGTSTGLIGGISVANFPDSIAGITEGDYTYTITNTGNFDLDADRPLGISVFASADDTVSATITNSGAMDLATSTDANSGGIFAFFAAVDGAAGGVQGPSSIAIDNSGRIELGTGYAIYAEADTIDVVNSGTLTTNGNISPAVLLIGTGDTTFTTSGDITANGQDSDGIQIRGGNTADVTIEEGATVTGGTGGAGFAFRRLDGATNLVNAGDLVTSSTTAVLFATGDFDDTFELQTGSSVTGLVRALDGDDTFIFGGDGTDTFDVGSFATQFFEFEQIGKTGTSVWTLTGSTMGATPFAVDEGTITLDGTNVPNVTPTVAIGATLSGNGTVGDLTVNGALSPGMSIGTIATGDLTLSSSSTLFIEVEEGDANDLVQVTGSVTLGGGTLDVTETGAFAGSNPFNFTIIENDAADAVSGTFGTLINDFAFLTPTVNYAGGDGNDVTLSLTPNNTGGGMDGCNPDPVTDGDDVVCIGLDADGINVATDIPANLANNASVDVRPDAEVANIFLGANTDVTIASTAVINGNLAAGNNRAIHIEGGSVDIAGSVTNALGAVLVGTDASSPDGGSVIVRDGGSVTSGVGAGAVVVNSDNGSITVDGDVVTNGDFFDIPNNGASVVSTGENFTTLIGATGSVLTNGDNVSAVVANGDNNSITVRGDVTTQGANSAGVSMVNGTGGDIILDGATIDASGENSPGVFVGNAGVDIDVLNSTSIDASGDNADGISIQSLLASLDVDSASTITAERYGVYGDATSGGITAFSNAGTIEGTGLLGSGIQLDSGDLSGENSGTISGNRAGIILLSGELSDFTNSGNINANPMTGANPGNALAAGSISNLVNSGTIEGAAQAITVTMGSIDGLNNSGIVTSGSGSAIVARDAITLTNSGTITGGNGTAIELSGSGTGASTITNTATGEITGDILLGNADDSVTFEAGSSFTGDLDTGDGADTINIADGTVTGTVSLGSGSDIINLTTLDYDVTVDGGAFSDTARFLGDGSMTSAFTVDLGAFNFTSVDNFEQGPTAAGDDLVITVNADGSVFELYEILQGTLVLNGQTPGMAVRVRAGTTLMGTGEVSSLSATGGIIAPGNSIGTLTARELFLDAASTLQIEVDAMGNSDQLIVEGIVSLGGATLDVVEIGNFTGSDPFNYVIIDNGGTNAVTGTFGTVQNDFAFLTPTVNYAAGDGNDVQLTLTPLNTGGDGCRLGMGTPAPIICDSNDDDGIEVLDDVASIDVFAGVTVSGTGTSVFEGVIEFGDSTDDTISGDVTNNGSVIASGDKSGFSLLATVEGDIINTATGIIRSDSGNAVSLSGRLEGDFINRGEITNMGGPNGRFGDGVNIGPMDGSFLNDTGATITAGDRGVDISSVGGDFTNLGAIEGRFNGLDVKAGTDIIGGDFLNAGTIVGANEGAIVGTVNGDLVNTGTITGDTKGLRVRGALGTGSDGQLINEGTIEATNGIALEFQNGIADRVINSGTISGGGGTAIQFADGFGGNLELRAGFEIVGDVIASDTLGSDTLIFGGDGDASFDVSVIGAQYQNFDRLEKRGASTWTLSGMRDDLPVFFGIFDGAVTLDAASLGMTATSVFDGASLHGSGTVGDLEILSGATLSPGTDGSVFGTLTTGNLLLGAGSTLVINTNAAGTSDMIEVIGSVTLEGGVLDVVEIGDFTGSNPFNYTIIANDAADAVSGTFGTVQNDFAFLTATVDYAAGDGNDVQLVLTPNNVGTGGGCTPDAANGVDAVCSGIFDEDTPPNGYGSFDITDVTVLVESDALITPTGAGILLGDGATVTTEAGSRIEPQAGTPNNGRDGIAIQETGSVDHAGAIVTADPSAFGIAGRNGDDFTIVVRDTGSIMTSGEGAHGILLNYVASNAGNAGNVLMDGTITTSGAGADGIWVSYPAGYGAGGSDGTITVGGNITTSGEDASGIWAILGEGAEITINLTDGAEISSTGEGSYGIYLANASDPDYGLGTGVASAAITIDEGARVFSRDDEAIGEGSAVGAGIIDTTLTIAGEVARPDVGDVAINLDTGDDTIILLPTYSITGQIDGGEGTDTFVLDGAAGTTGTVALVVENDARAFNFEDLRKRGAGTWIINGDDAPQDFIIPLSTIEEGTLLVNAFVPTANANVLAGATLGGTGTVGDLNFAGGILSPGNSIGTLTTGNLTLDAASTFALEVDDMGNSDAVMVNGAVSLGGATLDVTESGTFAGTDLFNYLIIDNDDSDAVSGTFGMVQNDLSFLTASVNYAAGDGNDVQLTLTPMVAPDPDPEPLFPTVAETFNQNSVASSLDMLNRDDADADLVYMAILFTTTPQALQAFDTSSGEIYPTMLADHTYDAMTRNQRLLTRAREVQNEGWGIWGGAALRSGDIDGDGNAAAADGDSWNADIGVDYRGTENAWGAGVYFGYVESELDVTARLSTADADGWHLGGYARAGDGGAGFSAAAAISYSELDAEVLRGIQVNTLSRTARGSTELDALALNADARFGFDLGNDLAIGPILSLSHVSGDLGSVRETGAGALNLTSSGAGYSITRGGGGVFANWQGTNGAVDASLQYIAGPSEFADVLMSLEGVAGMPFTVRSPLVNNDAGLATVSGELGLTEDLTISAEARATFGADQDELGASVRIGWRF